MKVSLFLPTWNRAEFTRMVLEGLLENTPREHIAELLIIDAQSEDGTADYLKDMVCKLADLNARFIENPERQVVSSMVMAAHLATSDWIAKIDSDTIVPPQWLETCIDLVTRYPELWALGIEPSTDFGPVPPNGYRYARTRYVGGIGLFRKSAWDGLKPGSHMFSGWPEHQTSMSWVKGWIHPPIKAFLLNRLPFEPFKSISLKYIKRGWQRVCSPYSETQAYRWDWKFPDWENHRA